MTTKKLANALTLLVLLALALAACGPAAGDQNGTPAGTPGEDTGVLPPAGEPTTDPGALPDTGGTPETGSPPAAGAGEPTTEAGDDGTPETSGIPATDPAGQPGAGGTPTAEAGDQTGTGGTPTADAGDQTGNGGTPAVTPEMTPGGDQQGVRGAEILPATGRSQVTQLSELLGYQVMSRNGQVLGTASDYILNLCEAHILYIVLEPDPALDVEQGSQILIPYEVASLGGGVIDVDQQAILLDVDQAELAGAPAFSEELDMQAPDWETQVRDYWSQSHDISNLRTECRVEPGGEVEMIVKIAQASEVLGMELQDGNQNRLGQVDGVILQPESGMLQFVTVTLDAAQSGGEGQVLVPLRAVNIERGEAGADQAPALVLLVENQVLENAPRFTTIPDPQDENWTDQATQYWSQYVPMTSESQPETQP